MFKPSPFQIAVSCGVWFTAFLLGVNPAWAAIRYVKANATGANDGASWADAYTELQAALTAAVSGDELWVAAGTYKPAGPGGPRTATFQLKNGVGVYGGFTGTEATRDARNGDPATNETVLSGDLAGNDGPDFANNTENSYCVVTASGTSATAVLDGFTLTGGNANGSGSPYDGGGGLRCDTGSPTVAHCRFYRNWGTYAGGMDDATSSSGTLTDCVFQQNKALYGAGGLSIYDGSNPTVLNCNFVENSSSNWGGAIRALVNCQPTIIGCVFTNNTASYGGAVASFENCQPAIAGCVFSNNTATSSGGALAISFYGSGVPGTVQLTACTFIRNQATGQGGAIISDGCNLTMSQCVVQANSADSGGGLYNMNSDGITMVAVRLTNCSFDGNVASAGGGVYNYLTGSAVTNCRFGSNSASHAGGGMYSYLGGLNLAASLVNCTFAGNAASAGGGLYTGYGDTTFANCILWNNTGGQISQGSGSATATYSCIQGGFAGTNNIVNDPQFVRSPNPGPDGLQGTSDDDYGYLYPQAGSLCVNSGSRAALPPDVTDLDSDGDTTEPVPSDLSGRTRVVDGKVDIGAYEVARPSGPILRFVKIDAEGANNGTSWTDAFTDLQSAMSAAIVGSEIWVAAGVYKPDHNAAVPQGSGDRSATFQLINNVTIRGGFAGIEDPATFNLASRNLVANQTILSGDLAGDDGPNLTNTGENSNYVVTGNGTDATAILDGVTVSGAYVFGALVLSGSPTLRSCTFTTNSRGGMSNTNGSPAMTGCTFSHNGGGGLLNQSGSPTLVNCMFQDNSSSTDGGGMRSLGGAPIVTNCLFATNFARRGGGLYNASGYPSLTNCLFSGNRALIDGGGLLDGSTRSTLVNCTLTANSSIQKGGAIAGVGAGAVVINSVIWGNSAPAGQQIFGPATVTYSCVQGGAAGTGNVTIDPSFLRSPDPGLDGTWGTTDDDYGDVHLQAGSPCIDAANSGSLSTNVVTDLDRLLRVVDGDGDGTAAVDMGAYEFHAAPTQFTLTTNAGGGHGLISPASGSYPEGTVLTLTAMPDIGHQVKAWAGTDDDDSVSNANTVTFYSDRTVTVEFEPSPPQHSLAVTTIGGHGTVDPMSGSYDYGTVVVLTAIPDVGYRVKVWAGTDDDTSKWNTSVLVLCTDRSAAVEFEAVPTQYHLSTSVVDGHGTISPSSRTYDLGTTVPLSATPDVGYRVKTWIGTDNDDSHATANSVTMHSDRSVVVQFEAIPQYAMTASVVGGHGAVSPMSGTYLEGTVVTLTATPDAGYRVEQWSGTDDDTSWSSTNRVTVNSDVTVTVEFRPNPPFALVFVKNDATPGGDGGTWSSAFRYLQDALVLAKKRAGNETEIWVSRGVYQPDRSAAHPAGTGDRAASFSMVHGATIRGGFAGDEDPATFNLSSRDFVNNATALSGDLASDDGSKFTNNEENSYHVVVTEYLGTLDGFTITGGNANDGLGGGGVWCTYWENRFTNCVIDGNTATYKGGGMVDDSTRSSLTNCMFRNNVASGGKGEAGGGLYMYGSDATLTGCVFIRNWARGSVREGNAAGGGGVFSEYGSPTFKDCTFSENFTPEGDGGGLQLNGLGATLTNCTFSGNWAHGSGGGIVTNVWFDGAALTNCTLSGNSAGVFGGGLYHRYGSAALTNCVLAGNSAFTGQQAFVDYWGGTATLSLLHSLVQGGVGGVYVSGTSVLNWGVGSVDIDPMLAPDNHLRRGSPCADQGTSIGSPVTDREEEGRPYGAGVDIGSDEFIDIDDDGLPDWWETQYFASTTDAVPDADPDGDGLSNLQEYEEYGGHPTAPPLYVDGTTGNDAYNGVATSHPFEPPGNTIGPKRTIQAALSLAGDGDTVLVADGTYSGPGNVELDYGGKSVVVRGSGSAATQIDCAGNGRAVNWESIKGTFGVLEGCAVLNGLAEYGAGIRLEQSRFMLKDCLIYDNQATGAAGGLHVFLSNPTIDGLTIGANAASEGAANSGIVSSANIRLSGHLDLQTGLLQVLSSWFEGPGDLRVGPGATVEITGQNAGDAPTVFGSKLVGQGTIQINSGQQLRFGQHACVDMRGQDDGEPCVDAAGTPGGRIVVDGTLLVQDNAIIRNTNLEVRQANLSEGGGVQYNNIFMVDGLQSGGQFFVSDSAVVSDNAITSEGDRYLDLDPDFQAESRPVIRRNRIGVIIKTDEMVARGTLLELRALDYDAGHPNNPLGASGAFPAVGSHGFTVDPSENWVLESLEIQRGAKLNLTDRPGFEFHGVGIRETVYVEKIKLHTSAVLNTALQTLYYEQLIIVDDLGHETVYTGSLPYPIEFENSAKIVDVPLLGFSLGIIAMNDTTSSPFNEFDIRVRQRLRDPADEEDCQCDGVCPDNDPPQDPSKCVQSVISHLHNARAAGDGVMEMRTQADGKQSASSIAAKGSFARAGQETIVVRFEYLFMHDGDEHDAEIIVKLSDNQDVGLSNYEVGRVRPPVSGQPGSMGSGIYALYDIEVPYDEWSTHLTKFVRGTYIELELRGKGAAVRIDNWDPQVTCRYECASFDGVQGVTEADFLILLAEYGRSPAQSGHSCLDMWLTRDQHLDLSDLLSWDTYVAGGFNSCGTGGATTGYSDAVKTPAITTATFLPNTFVIGGKPTGVGSQQDRIYTFNTSGSQTGAHDPWSTPSASPVGYRGNGRLIRDKNNNIYQLHGKQGLIRSDGVVVIPPKSRDTGGLSWNGKPVSVGVTPTGGTTFNGIPFTDVTFDSNDPNVAYVTPVLVWVGSPSHSYRATAKLTLSPSTPGQYSLSAVYGADPWSDPLANSTTPPEASYSATRLREVEIDRTGSRLFVTSSRADNSNEWLLIYDTQSRAEMRKRLTDLSPALKSPTAMLASSQTDKLYLASADASNAGRLHRLDIAGADPAYDGELLLPAAPAGFIRHITALSEDPDTGTLYVLGFQMPVFGDQQMFTNTDSIFTTAFLLAVTPADPFSGSTVQQVPMSGTDLALPMSLVYTGVSPADFNADGHVNLADLEVFIGCGSAPAVSHNGDCGKADFDKDTDVDATDFAAFQRAWRP